jgi:hypothetical protein
VSSFFAEEWIETISKVIVEDTIEYYEQEFGGVSSGELFA